MDIKIFLRNKKVLEKIRINNMIKKFVFNMPTYELGSYKVTEDQLTVHFDLVKKQRNIKNNKLTTVVITKIEYEN